MLTSVVMSLVLGAQAGEAPREAWDLVVVAPHSDDEAIGCTGVILRAVAQGRRVGIVVATAGDAHRKCAAVIAKKPVDELVPDEYVALAALRQRHTLEAMSQLGVKPADVLFLGYPDGGMRAMYEADGDDAYRQPYTQRAETYGPVVADYHTQRHGRPAPYVKRSVVDDLAEIFRERRPQVIYTTNEVDTHPDHGLMIRYVRDAAAAAEYRGKLFTYVVHGRAPTGEPALRLTLSDDEQRRKRRTIEIYQAGVSPIHDYLADEYARPEELFWSVPLGER